MSNEYQSYERTIDDISKVLTREDRIKLITQQAKFLAGLLILEDHYKRKESCDYEAIINRDEQGQLMMYVGSYLTADNVETKRIIGEMILATISKNASLYYTRDIVDAVEDRHIEFQESLSHREDVEYENYRDAQA
ncbi:MAG TPA: hypothetical protein VHZ76_00825 [Gammaproteobacteria bacterium]|jgi:hypothetical protein|nr:hypothetical protein [Gammaproteobacteria bacterium]